MTFNEYNSNDINNNMLEIATSLVGGTLTLFLGTGFSNHMTDGNAPNWNDLLLECARKLDSNILEQLFDEKMECKFNLTICAQILEEKFKEKNMDIRDTVCKIIEEKINENTINKNKVQFLRDFLVQYKNINIITTNYDSIINDYILPKESRIYVEGKLFPKTNDIINIFHIHGSIKKPNSLILTHDDYFKFQHKESYLSRKLYTLLHESTTVIIGYSLEDFNLNRILNEYKYSKLSFINKSDLYYISRNKVNELHKSYYYSTYGINVIDNINIDEFFVELQNKCEDAEIIIKKAKSIDVSSGDSQFSDDYLKLSNSFYQIISGIITAGYNLYDEAILTMFIRILTRKWELTKLPHEWSQYAHLADWLLELGSLIDLENININNEYLNLVKNSFSCSNDKYILGYSWKASRIWKSEWYRLTSKNQSLIKDYINQYISDTNWYSLDDKNIISLMEYIKNNY